MIESTPHQHQQITKMPNTPIPLNPLENHALREIQTYLFLYFSLMNIHKHMVLTTYLNSKPIQFHTHQHIKIIKTK